jgi:hypothetical protein
LLSAFDSRIIGRSLAVPHPTLETNATHSRPQRGAPRRLRANA